MDMPVKVWTSDLGSRVPQIDRSDSLMYARHQAPGTRVVVEVGWEVEEGAGRGKCYRPMTRGFNSQVGRCVLREYLSGSAISEL